MADWCRPGTSNPVGGPRRVLRRVRFPPSPAMSKMIYLDNAATTPLLPQVKEVLKEALEVFGNPSSIHEVGVEASERLKRAREEIASVLGVINS